MRTPAHYSFSIGLQSPRGFAVHQEECVVKDTVGKVVSYFAVKSGAVLRFDADTKPVQNDSRLYLVNASGVEPFRSVYEELEGMEFYSPDPEAMKKIDLDTSGPSDILERDGQNAPSVLERIGKETTQVRTRIDEYMQRIVPGLRAVDVELIKTYKFLSFQQDFPVAGVRTFTASSMSDGTLRALTILIALFQRSSAGSRPTLVAIEEPETGLHPAGAEILFDALTEGALRGQIIVTSHSPDLLDNREIQSDCILAVEAANGTTTIGALDQTGRSSLRKRLYTAGELLRMDQLKPDQNPAQTSQPVLFDAPAL
jgi:predicted ATPase